MKNRKKPIWITQDCLLINQLALKIKEKRRYSEYVREEVLGELVRAKELAS